MTPTTTTPMNNIARIFEMMTANESIKTPYTNHKLKAIRMILNVGNEIPSCLLSNHTF